MACLVWCSLKMVVRSSMVENSLMNGFNQLGTTRIALSLNLGRLDPENSARTIRHSVE
jgi:hypothetical protein